MHLTKTVIALATTALLALGTGCASTVDDGAHVDVDVAPTAVEPSGMARQCFPTRACAGRDNLGLCTQYVYCLGNGFACSDLC
jgi:hypothetical protein